MAEWTPAAEGGSSVVRASSPGDLLTVYVVREPRPAPAQAGPIAEETCCLPLLSSFSVFDDVKSSKQKQLVVDIYSKFLHGLEVHLVIKGKKKSLILMKQKI